ncbi:transporter substrate-binding domain-containing protein [Vibrio sp. SCSIO 43136]|uniref:substrate-binding periplasmic protein n=1 Tax=Vibrio sp. SCSIO 43136 TaxID=2819101 RepID=UPI0020762BB9|nr:transporter substrate-binding domain-containing protein [Vibrio sp. SCSIO 43136]USD67052.1 transporter substrate-binding domain-containing protein [Vibrio sp. SCSIO 43136]
MVTKLSWLRLVWLQAVLLVITSSAFAAQSVIVYGDMDYPPYSYQVDGKPEGIYVEILTEAFSRMPEYEVSIRMTPWKRGLKNLKDGRVFALFPPYYTELRDPWMKFSAPILREQVVVFGKREIFEDRYQWPVDYYGLKIGLNRGFNPFSMGGNAFGDAVEAGRIRVDESANNDSNLAKLVSGRIDAYINDQFIDISDYPEIVIGGVANVNHGHLGYTRKTDKYPYSADFQQQFDTAIGQMIEENQIEEIVNAHLAKLKAQRD